MPNEQSGLISRQYTVFYPATLMYIFMIVSVNFLYPRVPVYHFGPYDITGIDSLAGLIYLFRDFAQRELRHYIFAAMLCGSLLSYLVASPNLALASVAAFITGELVDWSIFTLSRKPLRERLIFSSCLSAPVDSIVFLAVLGRATTTSIAMMTLCKLLAVVLVWALWVRRYQKTAG